MQPVTMYASNDGRLFKTEQQCRDHEALGERCQDALLATLGDRPELKHGRWKQHTQQAVMRARYALVQIAKEVWPNEEVWKRDITNLHPWGIAGRIATDSNSPFARAWGRLMCINFDNFREYDQPYFALNPQEARDHDEDA